MTIILFLLVVSLTVAAGGLAFFLWSLRTGQYDDLDGAANRILFDDGAVPERVAQASTARSGKASSLRERHSGLT
jgi:cbb3-type cytochrome oxidase maturation protein